MATKQLTVIDAIPCCPSVQGAALSEDDAQQLAQAFAALADPVRLRLLSMIASADEVCSCNLMEPLRKSQPTISHHTKAGRGGPHRRREARRAGSTGEPSPNASPPSRTPWPDHS